MKWSAISALLAAPLALAAVGSASPVAPTSTQSATTTTGGASATHTVTAGSASTATPTSTQSATTTAGGALATYTVTVGSAEGALTYSPSSLVGLQIGDVVHFTLASGASEHTITQAIGDISDCKADPNGVSHVFDPTDPTTWVFDQPVEYVTPFFAFCNVPGHCQEGMTFSVNVLEH